MSTILEQRVFAGALDLSGQLSMVDVDTKVETQPDARMGDRTAVVLATRMMCELQFGGFWDPDTVPAIDLALFNDIGAIRPWAVSLVDGTEGEVAYLGNAVLTARKFGGAHGSNAGMTLAGMTRDTPAIRGLLLRKAEGISSGGNGTAYEHVAVPAGKRLWAALFVWGGSSIDIDVTVESDVDANFDGSETEQIDFGNITAVGSQFLFTDGSAITDTFYRVVITHTGGTGINLAVFLGVW